VRYGLSVPVFAEPTRLVDLAWEAETSGWDGFFVWDHLLPDRAGAAAVANPWVLLGAIAARTTRIRIGTNVTPLPRRRPAAVAREAVTVDRLSGGRMVLGVGLGNPPDAEYATFAETTDRRAHAQMCDEALDVIAGCWSARPFAYEGAHYRIERATFTPPPLQRPRIPVWVACGWPATRPLARAARWDGVSLGRLDRALTTGDLAGAVERLTGLGADVGAFDVAVNNLGLPEDAAAYEREGATWWLASGTVDDIAALASRPPR